ncbi:MAG TPA: hypothetical protein VEK57_25865 [Thermoanaerobaculia bacterium]|nr:hypothetical protein [Thermoanaerobaculia bacterium]
MTSKVIPEKFNSPTVDPLTPEIAVQEIRTIRDRIPSFALLRVAETLSLTRAATISMDFIHAAINAVAALLALRGAIGRDAMDLRLEVEEAARWSQVLDEIDALRLGVIGAIRMRRYRLGTMAFRVYQLSRSLVRDEENAVLLPHIDAMKRAAKFGKHRPQGKADPQPDDAPVPKV